MNTSTYVSDRTWNRFTQTIDLADPESVAYVYRLDARGRAVRPFWLRTTADRDLVDAIQLRGGGRVRVIIRRGRKLVFAAYLVFAPTVCPRR